MGIVNIKEYAIIYLEIITQFLIFTEKRLV